MTQYNHLAPLSDAPTTLALFGATGGTGRAVLQKVLDDGHRVRVLARRAGALPEHPNLQVIQGDVMDPVIVRRTLLGCSAVVVCLGAPALSRSLVRSEGTQVIVDAMRLEGIDRIVCLSLMGANESRSRLTPFLRYVVFPTYLRRPTKDHERQEDILRASGLDYTIVRPPHLTDDEARGEYVHGFGDDTSGINFHISRADLASFMLAQVNASTYRKAAVCISDLAA